MLVRARRGQHEGQYLKILNKKIARAIGYVQQETRALFQETSEQKFGLEKQENT